MERRVSDSRVTLAQLMGVVEANTHGNVHGGIIMKLCDEAGAMAAAKHARRPVVTVAVDSMTFHSPINLGDLVTVTAELTWVGHTSMEARVAVAAENVLTGEVTSTNTAYIVYVALDDRGRPAAVPGLLLETEDERRFAAEGEERRAWRLERRRKEQR
jgi:acyl-CoA hydrolase